MLAATRTTTVLLEGLHDPSNLELWQEFDGRYRPVLTAFARRLGWGEADAEELAQETLTRFYKSYSAGGYDRSRGRLSTWIVGIARNCAGDLRRRRAQRQSWRGESALVDFAEQNQLELVWNEECRRMIVDRALRELREATRFESRTIKAFEMLVLDERAPADVAAALAMSVDGVYTAKNRCLAQLREIVAELNGVYEVA